MKFNTNDQSITLDESLCDLCAFVVKMFSDFLRLCFLAPLRFVMVFVFACSATFSLASAELSVAAVTREQSAAFVSFQSRAPLHLPPQNDTSADTRETPACHFGELLCNL